ncbi:MAG: YggT family protein [Burkholderiales bacterium]|nr:YggT family protein [Burkholderiales bacterium]
MLLEIVAIALRAAYWVLLPAALLRFQMQAVRAPFRNPIGRFVCAVTDWIVLPLRRVLGGRGGLDWASLVAALAFELLHGLLLDAFSVQFAIFRGGAGIWLAGAVFSFAHAALTVALWLLIVYAVMSWLRTDSPIVDVLEALVNPWLKPLRRRMPLVGGFDLSPLVLVVLLQIGMVVLAHGRSEFLGMLVRA